MKRGKKIKNVSSLAVSKRMTNKQCTLKIFLHKSVFLLCLHHKHDLNYNTFNDGRESSFLNEP